MTCFLLLGDDHIGITARREELRSDCAARVDVAVRYDLTDEDTGVRVSDAFTSMSLFGGARLLEVGGADNLTQATADAMAHVAEHDVVIMWGRALPRGVVVPAQVKTEKFPATPAAARLRLLSVAKNLGLGVPDTVLNHLLEKTGHDIGAGNSVLNCAAAMGVEQLSAELVDSLWQFAPPSAAMAWTISAAVENGDLFRVVDLTRRCEPVAVISYLASRAVNAGRALDLGATSGSQIATALGISPTNAHTLLQLAGRLGQDGVAASLSLLVRADRAVKVSKTPHAVLDRYLVELATLWSPGRDT